MRVDLLPADVYLDRIVAMAKAGRAGYCGVCNVHHCMVGYDDPEFRAISEGADILISDSTILHKAIELRHGIKTPRAIRGCEIMIELCARAERDQVPVALIGGSSPAVLAQLKRKLRGHFPLLNIAYDFSPPFRPLDAMETQQMVSTITASGAKLAFVGLGCPKQERWMAAHKTMLNLMMIGVGAAFDFNSGAVKPSPPWVHRAGLEWLYRFAAEPRRLSGRYLTTSPRFLGLLALDMIRSRLAND